MTTEPTYRNEKNPPFKRGVVKETDDKRARVRVEFQDEDGAVSYWLNVNQAAAAGNKSYWMPDVGAQVNCLVDWDGEDGTVLGALYSDKDAPPTDNGKTIHIRTAAGTDIVVDKESGNITITGVKEASWQADKLTITADVKVIGNTDFEGGYVRSKGHAIDDTHKHTDVLPGPALTGPPE